MSTSDHLPVHVVLVGKDRLSTSLPPTVHSLGRGLSAGSDRVRFLPTDKEDSTKYVHPARDLKSLTGCLTALDGLVIVTGHGMLYDPDRSDGDDADWTLSESRRGPAVASMAELVVAVPPRAIPADLLIIGACTSHRTRNLWRAMLQPDGVLLTTPAEIGVQAVTQWLAGLMSAVASRTGARRPTSAGWLAAFEATRQALDGYEKSGGARPTRHPRVADSMIVTGPDGS